MDGQRTINRTLGRWRFVCAAVICLGSLACTTWRVEPLPTPDRGSARLTGEVRLHLRDGTTVVLDNVMITTDSIFGVPPDAEAGPSRPMQREAYARRDVRETQRRAQSPEGTMLAALLLTIALVVGVTGGAFY